MSVESTVRAVTTYRLTEMKQRGEKIAMPVHLEPAAQSGEKKRRRKSAAASAPTTGTDDLFAALKAERTRLAAAEGVPEEYILCGSGAAELIYAFADAVRPQRAAELGMHVIDAGHFGTEFPVVATLVSRLREELRGEGEVEVIADRESKDFFSLA